MYYALLYYFNKFYIPLLMPHMEGIGPQKQRRLEERQGPILLWEGVPRQVIKPQIAVHRNIILFITNIASVNYCRQIIS